MAPPTRRFVPVPPIGLCALVLSLCACVPAAAGWKVTSRGAVLLNAGAVPAITELSGVTYLGSVGGLERFAAVQDNGTQLVLMDVSIAADGTIDSANAVSATALSPSFDFEGVAYTGPERGTVFISEETTPGVREYNLSTGTQLASVPMPDVLDYIRSNRGLESLARSLSGAIMWTANEEALSIDGPPATAEHGTTVRLLRLDDDGENVTLGPQFAYEVDPVHTSTNPDRSGLSDLVMLPDDTLLALERSAAATLPPFESRIYEIDFDGATDVSTAPFDAGLDGQSFVPVGKSLLWSGQAGTFLGENLEGLTLGPRLADGNWVLVGVVDNGGATSGNRIVSFELSLTGCSLSGDFNCDGTIDEADFTLWRRTFATPRAWEIENATGEVGTVDAADYTVWRDNLAAPGSGGSAATNRAQSVPEPSTGLLFWLVIVLSISRGISDRARLTRSVPLHAPLMSRPLGP